MPLKAHWDDAIACDWAFRMMLGRVGGLELRAECDKWGLASQARRVRGKLQL